MFDDMEQHDVKSIKDLLTSIGLGHEQKHEFFHIINFVEVAKSVPKVIRYRSLSHFEISVTRNSETDVLIDGSKLRKNVDLISFLSPGQSVDIKEAGKTEDGFIVFFTVDFLHVYPTVFNLIRRFPYFNMHSSPEYHLSKKQSDKIISIMQEIYLKFHSPSVDDFEVINFYLNILLFESKWLSDKMETRFYSRSDEITYQFENLLKQNKTKSRVSEFANQMNVSTVYLSQCIKSSTGKSAKNMITEYRIGEAKTLLSFTEKPVDEIGSIVGFDNRSNFINFFKKNVGVSPKRYRNS